MATRNTARHSAGAMLLALSLAGMIRAAYADCSPNSAGAVSGSVITCNDTAAAGFIAGATADNLTVNIGANGVVHSTSSATLSVPGVAIQVGSGDLHDDEIHTVNVITNNGTLVNTGGTQTNNYVVNLNGSHNTLINNRQITLSITAADIIGRAAANTATARAIFSSSSAGEFEGIHIVNNASGSITVKHAGTGNMGGFYPGEDIDDFVIDNYGTVSVERTSTLTVTANSAGALVAATPIVTTPATLGIGAAFDGDDDTEQYVIRNHATGMIEAKGAYSAGVYARAPGVLIVNDGIIRNNSVVFGPDPNSTDQNPPIVMTRHEIAISSHGGSYLELDNVNHIATVTIGKSELQNNGTIIGDILMVDPNALRYWAREANGLSITNAQMNQGGRRDSEIENHAGGVITGNIYLGAGAHEIENAGTITGNIKVNQADIFFTVAPTAAQNPNNYLVLYTYSGGDDDDDAGGGGASSDYPADKRFTLNNTGVLNGDITIRDAAGAINSITLIGGGFNGSISATTGTGNNTLNLLGNGTLPSVTNFSTLNVGFAPGGEEEEEEEEESGGGDDDDDAAPPAKSIWTIAADHEVEFGETNIGNGGVLIVNGELESEEVNILANGTLLVEETGKVESEEVNVRGGGLLVVNGELEIDSDDDDAGVHIFAGGTLMGSGTIEGTVFNRGTIDLRNTTLTATRVNLEEGSVLKTTITGNGSTSADAPSANAGLLKVSATGIADPTAKIVPVSAAGLVRSGDWYRVATNTSGGSVFSTLPSVQNSALINWTIQENAASDLVIGATLRSVNTIPGLSSGGANTLNSLLGYTGDNENLLNVATEVQGLPTESAVRKAGEQLRPEANAATSTVALTINDRVQAAIDQRISQTNLAYNGVTGVSTGEGAGGRAGWIQGFGFYGKQDQLDGIDGYTASTAGLAIGADTAIGDGDRMRVGLALSYAYSKIDDDGVNSGNTVKVNSYQATLYGSYAMPKWYVNAALGLGFHQYDSLRLVNVGAVRDTDTANYDGTQYSAKVEAGLPLHFGKTTLIPVASLLLSRLEVDGYTESSSAGTGLTVDKTTTDSARTGLGAKALFDVSDPDTATTVEVRAIWLHEFGDTSQDTTAQFAAGGASFVTSGVDIGRDALNLGIGVRFSSANGRQQVLISYDAEIRDQYVGHTAILQARQEF